MRKHLILPIAALALTACSSLLAPVLKPDVTTEASDLRSGAYKLDPKHASLIFKIDHLGYSAYVGRFETLDASLDFDPANPATARLEARAAVASLDIGNDEFAAELIGPKWLDAAAFPDIHFQSGMIHVTGDKTGELHGDLTLHGVTKPVTLAVTFNGGAQDRLRGAYITGFSATGTIDRTDFGVSRYSGLITNDIRIEIEAEFIQQ